MKGFVVVNGVNVFNERASFCQALTPILPLKFQLTVTMETITTATTKRRQNKATQPFTRTAACWL